MYQLYKQRIMKPIHFILSVCLALQVSAQTKLLRQPTIHNNDVVFVYANDLWKSSTDGGTAVRLTSDNGYESNPHFSNDGKWIAFTAQYDGNIDVFIIPSNGGTPKRLTYHPASDYVQGWTPDNTILFRSNREGRPTQTNKFFTVSVEGELPVALDIPRAAYGDISADGKSIAYTPITSWDPEWRNYRGGQAMPIWILDLQSKALITAPQTDKERHLDPVWLDGIVYYLSERDYTSNIWSFDPKTKTEKQMTFHKKFDTKSLDADATQLIYEQGGLLHTLNPKTGATKTLSITVEADLNFSRIRWESVTGRDLQNANISPKGKRAVFEYRGDIFTVPKENGTWRNLTRSSGSAERAPVWSPKGDKIAWFSDESGEYQMVIADQDGHNQTAIALPNNTFYFKPQWSPDGTHIAYTDTDFNIWILNINTKKAHIADTDGYAHPNRSMNPKWSPDSQWIAYAKQNNSSFKSIYAYHINSKKIIPITDPLADAISPVWDASGDYLYTLASTNYGLATGWLDMSSYDPTTTRRLYAVVLSQTKKAPHPITTDEEEQDAALSDDQKDADPAVSVTIDRNGLFDRAISLNLAEGNYVALEKAPKGHVFVAEALEGGNGLKIHDFDTAKDEASIFDEGLQQMIISEDRNNTLISKNGQWAIVNTTGKANFKDGKIDTNLKIKIDPKQEYKQIFKEGWRYMRDFLYVDNVHGAPWDDVYAWYSPWIDDVRHRTDLNYVVDIMSGEVAIGHSYVRGGDLPDVNRVPVGLLGADITRNKNGYQIKKIYTGERWNPETYAPLSQPGVTVNEDDYILAINGHTLSKTTNPYELLEQTAGREITITVNSKASLVGAQTVLIKPVSSERRLRYLDWVEGNRRKVEQRSKGKLAYVYVPNTGNPGFTSFNRYYFSQQDKKGVIIDERNNGGGSAADYMIDIMNRKLFGYFNSKTKTNRPWTTPMAGIWGPKVMIINERAGSGGDLLPYMFKEAKLGTLVGTRTWGGLVGTWDTPAFIDGGRMVAPRGGFYDTDGNWAVEGEGVAPDIRVIQHPKLVSKGQDPQLERAVDEAMKQLKIKEFEYMPEPDAPIRSKRPKGYNEER